MAESAARMKQQQAQEEAERQALVAKVRAQLSVSGPLLDSDRVAPSSFWLLRMRAKPGRCQAILTRAHMYRADRLASPNRDAWKTR
jgi:hypothetical protein